jgi:hypothetical protein
MRNPSIRLVLSIGFFLCGASFYYWSFLLQRDHAAATTSITKLDLAIHRANQIEILFLSPDPSEKSRETFKTVGYDERYFVTDTHRLGEESVSELKKILKRHYFTTEAIVPCHSPGQVLRFYENSTLLLEASLCLECTNLHFSVYPFTPASVTIGEKDPATMDLPELSAFFESIGENRKAEPLNP